MGIRCLVGLCSMGFQQLLTSMLSCEGGAPEPRSSGGVWGRALNRSTTPPNPSLDGFWCRLPLASLGSGLAWLWPRLALASSWDLLALSVGGLSCGWLWRGSGVGGRRMPLMAFSHLHHVKTDRKKWRRKGCAPVAAVGRVLYIVVFV